MRGPKAARHQHKPSAPNRWNGGVGLLYGAGGRGPESAQWPSQLPNTIDRRCPSPGSKPSRPPRRGRRGQLEYLVVLLDVLLPRPVRPPHHLRVQVRALRPHHVLREHTRRLRRATANGRDTNLTVQSRTQHDRIKNCIHNTAAWA